MMRDVGRVVAVNSRIAGDELAADTSAGATALTVVDALDFVEDGGLLVINDETLPYSAVDPDTGVLTLGMVDDEEGSPVQATLGADAEEGDRVAVFDPLAGAVAQDVVAYVAVEGADFDADALEVVVPHALTPYLPEGIREPGEGESVTIEWRDGTPVIVDVHDQAATLASESGGWSLSPEAARFNDVAVEGTLGANQIAASAITLGDEDLSTRLDAPAGLVAYANLATGTDTATIDNTDPATLLFTFSLGVLRPDRRYLILCQFHANASASGEEFDWHLTYDTDGAVLTQADHGNMILDGSVTRWVSPTSGFGNGNVKVMGFVETDSGWGAIINDLPVNLGLVVEQVGGTNGVKIGQQSANRSLQLVVLDVGGTTSPVVSQYSQKSKSTGSPDADPATTRTRTWTATSGRAFDGDGGRFTGDENTDDLYQGFYSSTHGNTRSLFLFDSSDIQSKLSGATIEKVKLTFRVKHAYYNAGVDLRFRTHNNGALPSSWSGVTGEDNEEFKYNAQPGSTYTITLPVGVGDDFKSGAAKGFCVGKGPTTAKRYYGYLAGPDSANPPKLTITYTK